MMLFLVFFGGNEGQEKIGVYLPMGLAVTILAAAAAAAAICPLSLGLVTHLVLCLAAVLRAV